MLNLILGDPQYGQYDYGSDITIQVYQQDKATPFNATGLIAVIQTFKRYGDDNFLPFKDVARAIRLTGNMAQVIDDIPITFTDESLGQGIFQWTRSERPSLFGRFWIRAVLINGSVQNDDPRESTRFVPVYVHPGAPQ